MWNILVGIVLLSSTVKPDTSYVIDYVSIAEFNIVVRKNNPTFSQVLFYVRNRENELELLDWRPIKGYIENLTDAEFRRQERAFHDEFLRSRPHYRGELPRFIPNTTCCSMFARQINGRYYIYWNERGAQRLVISSSVIFSITNYDPEVENKKPGRGLSNVIMGKKLQRGIMFMGF